MYSEVTFDEYKDICIKALNDSKDKMYKNNEEKMSVAKQNAKGLYDEDEKADIYICNYLINNKKEFLDLLIKNNKSSTAAAKELDLPINIVMKKVLEIQKYGKEDYSIETKDQELERLRKENFDLKLGMSGLKERIDELEEQLKTTNYFDEVEGINRREK